MSKTYSNSYRLNMRAFGEGDVLRLVVFGPFDWHAVKAVLLAYSCYPPALPKIERLLTRVGWYECVVSHGWFRGQYGELQARLAPHNIRATCEFMTLKSRTPLKERIV